MSPHAKFVERMKALALDLELFRLDSPSVRASVLIRLNDAIQQFEKATEEEAAADSVEYANLRSEVHFE